MALGRYPSFGPVRRVRKFGRFGPNRSSGLNLGGGRVENPIVVTPPPTNASLTRTDSPEATSPYSVLQRLHVAEEELAAGTGPALTLVVPMFCEAARIERSLSLLAAAGLDGIRLVLVDDGSTDATVTVAQACITRLGILDATVRSLPRNAGKGAAVRAGILSATTPYVGFVDADLSMDPSVIRHALTRIQTTHGDVVVGERVIDSATQPRFRRVASVAFRRLSDALAPTGVRDPQCALKIFRREVAQSLFGSLVTNGFSFDVEILVRARKSGVAIDEMAIRWTHQPGSKVSPLTDSLRMIGEVRRIRRQLG